MDSCVWGRPDGRGRFLPEPVNRDTPHPHGVPYRTERANPDDWMTHSHSVEYTRGSVQVDALDVSAPSGDRFVMPVVRLPRTAVALVVAEGPDGPQVLTLWTYRHPVGAWGHELPGGGVDPGEVPAEAARREAAEETGLRPEGPGRTLAVFEPRPGEIRAETHIHLWELGPGTDLAPTRRPRDPLEPGRVRWIDLADVPALGTAGLLLGSGTLVGLWQYRAERGR